MFDTTTIPDGAYVVRITASNDGGFISTAEETINVNGELKLGNFSLSFNDVVLPVSGIPIGITRTYDTLNANTQGDFGDGWTMSFRDVQLTTSTAPQGGDQAGFGSYPAFQDGTHVWLMLPGGKREMFTFDPQPFDDGNPLQALSGEQLFTPNFDAGPGVTDTLTVAPSNNNLLMQFGDGFVGAGDLTNYNPEDPEFGGVYILTTHTGLKYTIDINQGVVDSVSDLNGNTVNYSDNGVFSSSGASLTFTRDFRGRITSVVATNADGSHGPPITYAYDNNGNLTSVTDANGGVTSYTYGQGGAPIHYMTGITDPQGNAVLSATYDATTHRLSGLVGPTGGGATLGPPDLNNLAQTVTDANNHTTTTEYDSFGNPIRTIQQADPDSAHPGMDKYIVTVSQYDANNNMTAQSQPFPVYVPHGDISQFSLVYTTAPTAWATHATYDQFGDILTSTDALGGTTSYFYNGIGELTAVFDPMGRHTFNNYDAAGNLISTTDPSGNTTHYTYDSRGDVLSTTDSQGHTTSQTYDIQGRMTSSTSVTGVTTNYTYGASDQVTSTSQTWTNPTPSDGLANTTVTTSSTYDADGRVTSTTDANGQTTHTYYTADGQVDHTVDTLNNTTSYVYDAAGNLIQTTNPDGTVTRTYYDALNRAMLTLDSFIPGDPNFGAPLATRTVYNTLGQVVETDTVSGAMINIIADPSHPGMMMATIASNGTVVSSSTTTYNDNGTVASTTSETGQVTTYAYDVAGRQTSQTLVAVPTWVSGVLTNENITTSTTYDADGNQTSTTDAAGNVTHYIYDSDGNLLSTVYPNSTATLNTYNSLGQKVATQDQLGNTTTYSYDAAGNLTRVVQPQIQIYNTSDVASNTQPTTTYTYDNYGDELTQTDAKGNTTSFEYDSQGRQVNQILPGGQTQPHLTTYDSQGRLSVSYDNDGNTATYTYDSLGRVSSIVYADSANHTATRQTVSYTYDALGRQHTVTDQSGTTTYTYDNAGNLITEATPEGTLHYVYNTLNQHTETWTGTGSGPSAAITDTQYAYDALGRLTTVTIVRLNNATLATPTVTTYSYDANGNLAHTKLTSASITTGLTTDYTYNSVNELTNLVNKLNTTTLSTYAYTYDADGNKLTENESDGSPFQHLTWTYNAVGELTSENIVNNGTTGQLGYYRYDADGNRLFSGGDPTDPDYSYVYNADNELTSESNIDRGDQDNTGHVTNTYSYDANGSLTTDQMHESFDFSDDSDSTTTYTYDVRNRMSSVANGNGTTTYVYDDAGNRVKETTGSTNTTFLTDSNNPTGYAQTIEEHVNGATNPSITYFTGIDTFGQANGSTIRYFLKDGRGFVRQITSSTGAVQQRNTYDPFGNVTSGATPLTTHYMPDGALDIPSQLVLHGVRYEEINPGIFTQRDFGSEGQGNNDDPITLNSYIYANANPIKYTDPSGHEGDDEEVLAATSFGEFLDATFARGIQVASRFARPLVSLLSAGAAWLTTQGQNALEFLRDQGTASITYIQQAFLHQQTIVTEEEAEAGPIWNTFQTAKNYLNELLTGSEENPEGIQWHHLVNQASKFSDRLLNAAANLVPTPTAIHRTISAFLASRPDWLPEGFTKVQDFVTTLDWNKQYEIGLKIWQSAMYGGNRDDFADIIRRFIR